MNEWQLKKRIELLPEHTQDEILHAFRFLKGIQNDYVNMTHRKNEEIQELYEENARLKAELDKGAKEMFKRG